jgi:hypothetical protein
MVFNYPPSACDAAICIGIGLLLDVYIYGIESNNHLFLGYLDVPRGVMVQTGMGLLLYTLVKPFATKWRRPREKKSVYGLEHGRLHLQVPTAMWMNMGYWKGDTGNLT